MKCFLFLALSQDESHSPIHALAAEATLHGPSAQPGFLAIHTDDGMLGSSIEDTSTCRLQGVEPLSHSRPLYIF